MKHLIALGVLAAFAAPVVADDVDGQDQDPRLNQLETLIVTALKDEPAAAAATDATAERLTELEIVVSTAPKQQPEDFEPSARTAELLAELDEEAAAE